MEPTDVALPVFDVPPSADAPVIPPDTYARWVAQNIERLRQSGRLDELCAARLPVNARFTFPDSSEF